MLKLRDPDAYARSLGKTVRMQTRDRIYIDGAWVPSGGTGTIDVVDSATEEVIATVPDGVAADVDRAVAAAKAAFATWSETPLEERGKYLRRVSEGLEARRSELAEVLAHELGMPLKQAAAIQVGLPLRSFTTVADLIETFPFEEQIGNGLVVREPIGVVGAITPWNYPLNQIAAKVAPALAAGCTVVLKPSEVTPLCAYIIAEILDDVGLPPGVFNMVSGVGPVVGEAIAAHPDVDMVSFTGSTRAGKRVTELAAQTVKRVTLELGGKSPNIILDDADLEKAVTGGVAAAYANCGQTCSALTRMLVPRSKLAEAEVIAARVADSYTVGDPFSETSKLGPLVSRVQHDRVKGYIDRGVEEGARLVAGGPGLPDGVDRGFFVRPTVFSDVRNDMAIAQEEIFGPVLSMIPYDTEEEAIEIANDTIYGLAAGVWGGDPERAQRVARKLRSGQVNVNGARSSEPTPFGGYKQSGNGREWGKWGLEEYLEVKALQI